MTHRRIYPNCQQNFWCPDKLGHFFGHVFLVYALYPFLGVFSVLVGVLSGILIEVFEATHLQYSYWVWFRMKDTLLDLLWDFGGVLLASLLATHYGVHLLWVVVFLFLGWFFVRFVSWEDLRENWYRKFRFW